MLAAVPGPEIDAAAPLQMLVTNLDWSDYVGRIAIGRLYSGTIRRGQQVAMIQAGGQIAPGKVAAVNMFDKLGRSEVEEATAGDIAAVVGLETITIGDTISELEFPRALPRVEVDEPTLQMTFGINTSPLSGRDGKYLTTPARPRAAAEGGRRRTWPSASSSPKGPTASRSRAAGCCTSRC